PVSAWGKHLLYVKTDADGKALYMADVPSPPEADD
ncbi:hypothetical protein LCGC14_3122940, partial [marine sediment metagenome]